MITYMEAQAIARDFACPNNKYRNITALAQDNESEWTINGLRLEVTREIQYGNYDKDAYADLQKLYHWCTGV